MNPPLRYSLTTLRVLVLATCLLGFSTNSQAAEPYTWFFTHENPARGLVIVTHGLNNKPEVMDPLIQTLTGSGFHAIRVNFSGHRSSIDSNQNATLANLLGDFKQAFDAAEASFPYLPKFQLGYSLGATVAVLFLEKHPDKSFERMVFLAPAFALKPLYSTLLSIVTPLRFLSLSLPSRNFAAYRAHDWTSLYAYHTTLEAVELFAELEHSKSIGKIRTLVYLSDNDEAVSNKHIKGLINSYEMQKWSIRTIKPESMLGSSYNHLILDEPTTGTKLWHSFTAEIITHFSSGVTSQSASVAKPPHRQSLGQ